MNFGSGSAKWRITDADTASPHRRGKKTVALAAAMGMGASLFGLTSLATSADAATTVTSYTNACVAASIIGDVHKTVATSMTVTAPDSVQAGATFTVRYQMGPGSYPNTDSGATTTNISRQKIDVEIPSGASYVSGSIVAGTGINISGTAPNILRVTNTGVGTVDANGPIIRMSGNNEVLQGTGTSGQSEAGILIPKTKKDLAGNTTSDGSTWFQLPAFEITYTATGAVGTNIEPKVRLSGAASTYGSIESYNTSLAKASFAGTQWAPTRCQPRDSKSSGLNGGAGPLATIGIVAASQATTTSLTAPATATINESVNLSAAVTAGSGTPTGTVQFKDGVNNIGSPVTLSGGSATLPWTFSSLGSHSITAVYSGASGYDASTSSASSVNVVKKTSATSLTAPANATVGTVVTLSASVTGQSPTGTVQFKDGVNNIGSPVTLSGGSASLNHTFTTTGAHSITAVYSGDTNNNGSTSSASTVNVSASNSTTSLTAPGTAALGASVSLSASVSGYGTPTGTVQFKDGVNNIGSPVALSAGSASLNHTFTTAGAHSITAVYSGDTNNNGSTSSASTVAVAKGNSSTSLTAPATANLNQSVTLSASVTGSSPTGTVQFKDGGADIGSPVALSGGSASMSWSFGSAGAHSITAVYSGDANNNGSTSSASTVAVAKGNSSTSLTAPGTATVGISETLSASVTGSSPTGTVQFKDGGSDIGTPVALSGGSASMSWSFSSAGNHSITAVYSGDANNNGSTSAPSTVVVSAATYAMTGQVTDVNSNPLAGITVQLRTGSGPNGVVDTTVSDGSGAYSFTVGAGSYRVFAFAPTSTTYAGQWYGNVGGRPDATVVSVVNSDVANIDITLLPAAQIVRGTVRNDSGQLLPGIRVRLTDELGTTTLAMRDTNDIGRYNFGALPAGDYMVVAQDQSGTYATTWYGDSQAHSGASIVTLTPSGSVGIDINMAPVARSISGTVSLEGGGAAAGVIVDLRDSTGTVRVAPITTTDASGQYTFEGLSQGLYRVYFRPIAGYSGIWFGGSLGRSGAHTVIVTNAVANIDAELPVSP